MEDQFLYRDFAADGAPLYNGLSHDWTLRLRQHWRKDQWCGLVASVTVERHPDRPTVRAAEAASIRAEHPKYNVQHNRTSVEADLIASSQRTAGNVVLMMMLGALAAYALYFAASAAVDRYRGWKADRDEFRTWKHSRLAQAARTAEQDEDASVAVNNQADASKVVPETVKVIRPDVLVANSASTPTVLPS